MSEDQKPDEPDQEATADGAAEEPTVVTIGENEYTIDPTSQDDFELLDDLGQMSRTGDPARAVAVMRRLLGPEQTRLALNRLRDDETGRVSIDTGVDFVVELLDGLNPN